jgi:hypothetical protein
VHGRTLNEAIECYRFMNLHADKIAINAMDIYLKKLGTGTTKLQQLMTGRKNFINILIDKHIVNIHKKHHLMGNTLPQEGYAYKDIK